jgi:HEPN domain-containing protein
MVKKSDFLKWFEYANRDFSTANYLIEGNRIDEGLFFLQQSIEKALKALLIKNKKELVKTHDLIFLGKSICLPKELLNYCKEISLFYNSNRYPDIENMKTDADELDNYINNTREILEWVEKVI